jgi:hypothetical protein
LRELVHVDCDYEGKGPSKRNRYPEAIYSYGVLGSKKLFNMAPVSKLKWKWHPMWIDYAYPTGSKEEVKVRWIPVKYPWSMGKFTSSLAWSLE